MDTSLVIVLYLLVYRLLSVIGSLDEIRFLIGNLNEGREILVGTRDTKGEGEELQFIESVRISKLRTGNVYSEKLA